MPAAVLGVDLAARRWRDNGSALLRFENRSWTDALIPAVEWPDDEPLTAAALATRIDEAARSLGATAVALDGPQAWRDPRRPPAEGVGRACEREAATQGKTGTYGVVYPSTQRRWFELSIALFADLLERPGVVLANDPTGIPARAPGGGYVLVESFPSSTWRTAGLTALPGKRRAGDVGAFAAELARVFSLPDDVAAGGHDDLQAVAAALAAAAVVGGPARAVARGVAASMVDGMPVEGLIWDAAPLEESPAHVPPIPVLVVVNGPPAAGKTTLARALAPELGLPLVSKDDLKEALFDALGTGDRAWSRRLGEATFELLYLLAERMVEAGNSAVLEANFDAEYACPRLEELRRRAPFRLVELYLAAPDGVLRERFAARAASGGRHPGHLDGVVERELDAGEHRGRWGQLPCADERVLLDVTDLAGAATRAIEAVQRAVGRDAYARRP